MKHTKGPWTLSIINKNTPPVVHAGTRQDGRSKNNWQSVSTHIPYEEEVANAHLISASPDMLDALEQLQAIYSDHSRSSYDLQEIRSIISSAIRKAKGQE